MNSVYDALLKRNSIRRYNGQPVSEDVVKKLIYAGAKAPSGKNLQPWRFIIVQNKNSIQSLSKLTRHSRFIKTVPLVILVYLKPSANYEREKDIIGIGACIENILLASQSIGLGACIVGEFFGEDQKVCDIIKADTSDMELLCGITIGQGDTQAVSLQRIPLDKIIIDWK